MAEPQSWGSEVDPYITSKGSVITREMMQKSASRDYIATHEHYGFAGWMYVCDVVCISRYGLGAFDFPDQTWFDWYTDRLTPAQAVRAMAENEGGLLLDLTD